MTQEQIDKLDSARYRVKNIEAVKDNFNKSVGKLAIPNYPINQLNYISIDLSLLYRFLGEEECMKVRDKLVDACIIINNKFDKMILEQIEIIEKL